MALIQCPECGRDNISDSATACPSCGFNVKQYVDEVNQKIKEQELWDQKYKEFYNDAKLSPPVRMDYEKENTSLAYYLMLPISLCVWGYIFYAINTYGSADGMGLLIFIAILMSVIGIWYIKVRSDNIEINKNKELFNEALYKKQCEQYEYNLKHVDEYKRKVAEARCQEWFKKQNKPSTPPQVTASEKKSEIVCPKCGCSSIGVGARGYSFWTGFVGSGRTVNRCGKCGYIWTPRG